MAVKSNDNQTVQQEPALADLCSKAVSLTNNISTHLGDDVKSLESQNDAFRLFAEKFQRLREILWKIQAGLSHIESTDTFVPYKASQNLSTKMQYTVRDLISSDLMVIKLLTSIRRKGFSKFLDTFKQASLNAEILALRDSMTRHRDELRIAWVAFNENLSGIDRRISGTITQRADSHDDKVRSDSVQEKESQQQLMRAASRKITVAGEPRRNPSRLAMSSPTVLYPNRTTTEHQPGLDFVLASRSASTASINQHDEPPTPLSTLQEWGKTNVWSSTISSHNEELHNRSLSETVTKPFAESPKYLTDAQVVWSSSTATTESIALMDALQRKDHQTLQQLLRGTSNMEPIPPSLLSQAIQTHDISGVRLLLTYGAPVNHIDDGGHSPLLLALATSSTDMVRLLLESGADVNFSPGDSSMSPFVLAARYDQIEVVRLMLDHKANVNEMSPDGKLPIHVCIFNGAQIEMIELLLSRGANPNGKTRDGKTPLFEALSAQRLDVVRLLLERGASPNLAGPKHPLWPATYLPSALQLLISRGAKPAMALGSMELAASSNNIESVKILLDAGVDPNDKKDGVYTPLCSAIRDDKAPIVALLLSRGADPNIPASEYPAWKCISHDRLHFLPSLVAAGAVLQSPPGIAELAVAYQNKDALMYLLLHGIDINACNEEGNTPLTTAIKNDSLELLDILLTHGADVTARGEDWPLCMALTKPVILQRLLKHVHNTNSITRGIIELAVQANELESIKLLVEAGISVEERTGGVFSPLTSAIRENRKELVRYFLDEAGADVNAPGEHLPLVKAIRRCTDSNDTTIIETLLEHGADINLIYRGWNAIMQVIEKGDKKLMHILIEKGNGIDLQAIDPDSGETVRDMISDRGWSDGIKLLMEHQDQRRMVTDGRI